MKMSVFNDKEFNIKKEDVLILMDRIKTFLMKDFDKKLIHHHKLDHKWYVQSTIHGVCRALLVDKQVVIYLILGSNPRRPDWGDLKAKYDIEPLKFNLRKEVVSSGKKLINGYNFKLFFTDTNRNGDFQMKVTFYPFKENKVRVVEDSKYTSVHTLALTSSKLSEAETFEGSKLKQTEKGAKFQKMVTVLADSSDDE